MSISNTISAKTLPAEAWYPFEELFQCLRRAPFAIRLVGGAVRDALWGCTIGDLDFAVQADYDDLREFCRTQTKIIVENERYGNIKARIANTTVDLTLLRQDQNCDGRHATIQTTQSWAQDALRRDFTINALYLDLHGNLHDPLAEFGLSGFKDIHDRRIRFVGDSDQRIKEDYLRILRFFRFHAQFECMLDLDTRTASAIAHHQRRLSALSIERTSTEWRKIVMAKQPTAVIAQMQEMEVLSCFLGQNNHNHTALARILDICQQYDYSASYPMRCVALTEAVSTMDFMRWGLRKSEVNSVKKLLMPHIANDSVAAVSLFRFGRTHSLQRHLLSKAKLSAESASSEIALAVTKHTLWQQLCDDPEPQFPISGTDVQSLGYAGVEIGTALRKLQAHWCQQGCQADRSSLLAWLEQNP